MARRQDLLPSLWQGRDQGLTPFSGGLLSPNSFFTSSPFQLARRMQDDFDRLFSLAFNGSEMLGQGSAGQLWSPTVDISQDGKEWRIEADLPGVNQDDIDIQVQNGALAIRAELKPREDQQAADQNGNGNGNGSNRQSQQQRQYHQRERRYGFFERVISLPQDVNEDQIQAEFNNGVLSVHIPKQEQAAVQGRRIAVQGGQQKALSGEGGQTNGQQNGGQQQDRETTAKTTVAATK